ncbi:DUF6565 domain-containing protein [Flavihumibacter fluvii]|uniref:DUF6565 domain-containing protein n=1 Tax=Flavihumibacter fluvii TaxID=2838157 RepID=UPI001BDE1B8B|nr:DUF6565 domain-containing protein [Flavihumibacter fluvii]ULQ52665.1 hypothetical protein KJS93_21485 [Flavihumibacter fluvii]
MKHVQIIAGMLLTCAIITSCGSQADKTADRELTQLGEYFDSIKVATPVYTEDNWDKIKTEYNNTIARVETAGEKLSDDVNKKLETTKADYNSLKDDYETHISEAKAKEEAKDFKMKLRTALFGDYKIGSDMQFNFVTANNALPVYDRFVSTVKENQNNYSREDWDEIKVLYEALDTRKNEIEKDLASSDNLKIAKLKVKFASINAVKRPLAKVSENDDAKQ